MAEAPKQSNPDYQDRDILIKPILYSVIGMAILTVLVVVGMNVFFHVNGRSRFATRRRGAGAAAAADAAVGGR
jgi:hypothetical protein